MVNYDAACIYAGRLFLEYSHRIEESTKLLEIAQRELEVAKSTNDSLRKEIEKLQTKLLECSHGKLS